MAEIKRNVIKKYSLELSEVEYHAILSLVGALPYATYKDLVNQHYSVMQHRGNYDKLKIYTPDEHRNFYNLLEDNR